MKVLVTGGCGFIGGNWVASNVGKDGLEIINIDKMTDIANNNINNYTLDYDYKHIKDDIINMPRYEDDFRFNGIDVCIHFAAESHVDRSIEDSTPFIDTNITGTLRVAEFCASKGIKMIHVSTDEVYGHHARGSTTRSRVTDPLMPRNPYAASKACAEVMVKTVGSLNPYWEYCIIRPSNNYGKMQDKTKFIPKVINCINEGTNFPMYGKGDFYREWTYVGDTVYIISSLIEKELHGECYNISSRQSFSNIELFAIIAEEFRKKHPNEYKAALIELVEDPRGNAHDERYAIYDSGLMGAGAAFRKMEDEISSVITDGLI